MKNTQSKNLKRSTCSIDFPKGDELPSKVHVMPLGEFFGFPDGKRFAVIDAQAIIDRSIRENVKKIKIDREHETTLAPKGAVIPASGWAHDFYVDAEGIWAHVTWTSHGAYEVGSGGFGYISPEFLHDEAGNVKAITRISLTSSPRLDLKALANQDQADFTELNFEDPDDLAIEEVDQDAQNKPTEKEPIMKKELLEALGLDETATVEQAVEAVKGMKTAIASQEEALKNLAVKCDIKDEVKPEEIISLATQFIEDQSKNTSVDPSKYVPIEDYKAICSQLSAEQKNKQESKINDMIDKAVKAGKIAPSSKDHYMAFANQDFEGCKALLESAPEIIETKQHAKAHQQSESKTGLSADEKSICSQMGITEEDFLKNK